MKKVKLEVSIKYSEIEEHSPDSGSETKPAEIYWTSLELERHNLVGISTPMIDKRVLLGFLDHVKSQIALGPNAQIRVDVEDAVPEGEPVEQGNWKLDHLNK